MNCARSNRGGVFFAHVCALTAIMSLAACGVFESRSYQDAQGCTGDLGGYNLPKTLLKVVYEETRDGGQVTSRNITLTPEIVPDGPQICLDRQNSVLAEDDVTITRQVEAQPGKSGILQFVSSDAKDQTGEVLRRLARVAFIALSGGPGGAPGVARSRKATDEAPRRIELIVDPLDPMDMARANEELRLRHVCVQFGRFSFNPDATTAADYCDAPLDKVSKGAELNSGIAAPVAPELQNANVIRPKRVSGFLYRPRLEYQARVLDRVDPNLGEGWRLVRMQRIFMENLSPLLSVRVDRTMFAQHNTKLIFDDGALQAACVEKGSAAVGFANALVEIANDVVNLPAQILKLDLDYATQQKDIADAETNLLKAQNALLRKQLGLPDDSASAPQTASFDNTPKPNETPADLVGTPVSPDTIGTDGEADKAFARLCQNTGTSGSEEEPK